MVKTCANCGAEVPEGARFCDNCGMLVSETASSPQEAPPQEVPPQQPPPAPPTPPSPAEQPVFSDPASSQQETLHWEQPTSQHEEALPLPSPPPVGQPPISVPPPPQQGGRPRRGLLILGGGLAALVGIGIAIWLLVPYAQREDEVGEAPPTEEASKPVPGYQLAEHESGNLSVEVPFGWEVDTEKYADLEGHDVSESEGIGPAITASSDLYTWNNIGGQVPGVYLRASRVMARSFTDDDQFLDSPSLDYSYFCERGARQDFDRPPYSGRMQEWKNCSGSYDQLLVAAAPEDRGCLVTLQMATHSEADRETARHILDTFDADCGAIT